VTLDDTVARLASRLEEGFADVVAELRELRQLVERRASSPAEDRDARLILALVDWMEADFELPFDAPEVLEVTDPNVREALQALGLTTPEALGYWLRQRKKQEIAGFRIRRVGRAWCLERCR
jgi:hypothetical protein